MTPINFFEEDASFHFTVSEKKKTIEWLLESAKHHSFSVTELNYIFCSDAYLLEMNQQYLKHETFTDIITFDLSESNTELSGDIFISIERVKENAEIFGVSFFEELYRVLIHGILHLIGFNDSTDQEKEKMRYWENFHLRRMNL